MTIDINNFYLNTHMLNFEYMRMSITIFHQNIIDQNKLQDIVTTGGYIYTSKYARECIGYLK